MYQMAKHSILISEELFNDISSYCKLNGLKVNQFCEDMLKTLLAREKFGDVPFGVMKTNDIPTIGEKIENVEVKIEPEALNVVVSADFNEVKEEQPKEEEQEKKEVVKQITYRKPKVRKL
jgi:hypothetical protein